MRKIDQTEDPVDNRIADRHDGVNAAQLQSADQHVDDIGDIHRLPPRYASRTLVSCIRSTLFPSSVMRPVSMI